MGLIIQLPEFHSESFLPSFVPALTANFFAKLCSELAIQRDRTRKLIELMNFIANMRVSLSAVMSVAQYSPQQLPVHFFQTGHFDSPSRSLILHLVFFPVMLILLHRISYIKALCRNSMVIWVYALKPQIPIEVYFTKQLLSICKPFP